MGMRRKAIVSTLLSSVAVLLVFFNNCGQTVRFSDGNGGGTGLSPQLAADLAESTESADSYDAAGEQTTQEPLSPEQEGHFVETLPPEEQSTPRPVSDLSLDSSLYEMYRCPTNEGVVICHLPRNLGNQATLCVGRQAVEAHYGHVRTFIVNQTEKLVSDYLGPCRFTL